MSTGRPSPRSPWGGVELLERAISYTRGSLALVTPELMSAPTPCAGWDLHTLLAHMDDSLRSLHEAASVRRVRLDPPGDTPADLVGGLRARACQLLAEWSVEWAGDRGSDATGPRRSADVLVDGRPLTPRVLTSAGALEVTVHGWDVAAACGVRRPIPDSLAADLMRVAPVLVSEADRRGRFGPPVPPAPDASRGDELVAYLGRSP